jgi:protein-disulfide isomerase
MSLTIPVTRHDHSRGAEDAAVTVVMYGDYECGDCVLAHALLGELSRRDELSLRWVFRHLPLSALHLNAETAAMAAEAAGEQGCFWQMHDALFEQQAQLCEDSITAVAARVIPDQLKFRHVMATQQHMQRIRRDFLGGIRNGAAGTPTLFFNGHRYLGALKRPALSTAMHRAAEAVAAID